MKPFFFPWLILLIVLGACGESVTPPASPAAAPAAASASAKIEGSAIADDAAGETDPVIKEIRQLYRELKAEMNRAPDAEFGLVSSGGWHRLKEDTNKDSLIADAESWEFASLYGRLGSPACVTWGFGDICGSATRSTEYFYRPDGSLAFLFDEQWIILGEPERIIETRVYFDPTGREIRRLVAHLSMEGRNPIPPVESPLPAPTVHASLKDFLATLDPAAG
jgi:hypothetical protein